MTVEPPLLRKLVSKRGGGPMYLAYPPLGEPRWLLPARRELRTASLRLYMPHRPAGRARKVAMSMGLFGARLRLDDVELARLEQRLAGCLNQERAHLALATGTPSAVRKTTIHAMAPGGEALAYAKIAAASRARERLKHERQVLDDLSTRAAAPGKAPQVLGCLQHDGCDVLVLSCGPEHPGPRTLGTAHFAFLDLVRRTFGGRMPIVQTATYRGAVSRLQAMAPQLTHVWRERYWKALGVVRTEFGDAAAPTTLAHNDFAPWNTRSDGHDLFVFDWEYGQIDAVAPLDVFHFEFMANLGLRRPLRPRKVQALLDRPRIRAYEHASALFLLFLVDIGCRYHDMLFARGGREEDLVLQTVARLIDQRGAWRGP